LFIQISDFIVYSFGGKIHTTTRQHASESGERKQAKNIYTILNTQLNRFIQIDA